MGIFCTVRPGIIIPTTEQGEGSEQQMAHYSKESKGILMEDRNSC